MNDSIDQLLAEMKGKYNPQDHPQKSSQPQPDSGLSDLGQPDSGLPDLPLPDKPKQSAIPSPQKTDQSTDQSIDDLLSSIDSPNHRKTAPVQQPIVPIQPSKNPKFDALLHPPLQKPQSKPNPQLDAILPSEQLPPSKGNMDNLLTDLKAIYNEQDRAIEQTQQQEREAEQRRQTALQRQQAAKINRQAQDWLDKLDVKSSEAAWFEEFAAKYESRIAAAIDYLGLK